MRYSHVSPCVDMFSFLCGIYLGMGFPGGSDGKEFACNAGDPGSIPGEEKSNLLQYSCLENPM